MSDKDPNTLEHMGAMVNMSTVQTLANGLIDALNAVPHTHTEGISALAAVYCACCHATGLSKEKSLSVINRGWDKTS